MEKIAIRSQNVLLTAKIIADSVGSSAMGRAHYSVSLDNYWARIPCAALSLLFCNAPSQREIGGFQPAKHDFCIYDDNLITRG
jgi:hypothetical protein